MVDGNALSSYCNEADPSVSGEVIEVEYRILCSADEAEKRSRQIAFEQTVELPAELIPDESPIATRIVGRILGIQADEKDPRFFLIKIAYPAESSRGGLAQLLNLLFGNISIQSGIRLLRVSFPPSLFQSYGGPRYGIRGLRNILNKSDSPLLCTALKPMGLSVKQMADIAYHFALGGIDIIKDDHGLADQSYHPFRDRVEAVGEAIYRAELATGRRALYFPSLLSSRGNLLEEARFGARNGAGGFLVSPGLVGFDTMHQLTMENTVALPVMAHPALLGSFLVSEASGISHSVLLGDLMRVAGADASIFPNYGGRFSFSMEETLSIATACRSNNLTTKPIFPVPAGGMTLERVKEMVQVYGSDTIFLVGGGLYGASADLERSVTLFRQAADIE